MDVREALQRRRMVRSFDATAIEAELLAELLTEALRAPTAGNSRGVAWVGLPGLEGVARYFDAATDERWRARSTRFTGLSRAGAAAICLVDPAAYVERYGEDDKASSGLGEGEAAWPVPYWFGDAGASTMALLLAAEHEGLAACFLGAFRRSEELKAEIGAPSSQVVYGCVLLGRADGEDHRSASLDRPGPSRRTRVHIDRWG